jgi:hypothetical protein
VPRAAQESPSKSTRDILVCPTSGKTESVGDRSLLDEKGWLDRSCRPHVMKSVRNAGRAPTQRFSRDVAAAISRGRDASLGVAGTRPLKGGKQRSTFPLPASLRRGSLRGLTLGADWLPSLKLRAYIGQLSGLRKPSTLSPSNPRLCDRRPYLTYRQSL